MSSNQPITSVEIETFLTGAVKDYGMFSEVGNAAVHALVVAVIANGMTWAQTYRALYQLSQDSMFAEALDTAVRECVYHAIGAYERDEDFWI